MTVAKLPADQVIAEFTGKVCKEAWLPTPYSSSRDSQETIDGNQANNRSRDAFCAVKP